MTGLQFSLMTFCGLPLLFLSGCASGPQPLPGVVADWHYRSHPSQTGATAHAKKTHRSEYTSWWISLVNRTDSPIDLNHSMITPVIPSELLGRPLPRNEWFAEKSGYWFCDGIIKLLPGRMINLRLETTSTSRCAVPVFLITNRSSGEPGNSNLIQIGDGTSAPPTLLNDWMRSCTTHQPTPTASNARESDCRWIEGL